MSAPHPTDRTVCSSIFMGKREFITNSAEETIELGRQLAADLEPPRLVLLRGDLGAGKTTMVKGIAEAFEAASQDDVTSPTFTLIHEYRGPEVSVYHIDLYRIDTPRELDTLGLDELVNDDRNVVLIEWGEKFPKLVKERDVEIAIERTGPENRKVSVSGASRDSSLRSE
jgi:tRNA threonylcarbamoyladenosine biosynthesis protein TsaE